MSNETKQCPYCGGEIMAQAKKCRHCGKWLTNDANKEPQTLDEKYEVDGHAVPHPISRDVNHTMQSRRMIVMMGGFAAIALIALLIWHFAGDSLFESVNKYIWRMKLDCGVSRYTMANIISYIIILLICLLPGYFALRYVIQRWFTTEAEKLCNLNMQDTSLANHFKWGKNAFTAISVFLIVAIAGGLAWYWYETVKEEQQKELERKENSLATFNKGLDNIKYNAYCIVYIGEYILDDIAQNWNDAIWNKKAVNEDGKKVYCKDFNTAVLYRYTYFLKHDWYSTLDNLYEKISKTKKEIEACDYKPANADESLTNIKTIVSDMADIIEKCKQPSGNLSQFSNSKEDMISEAKRHIRDFDTPNDRKHAAHGWAYQFTSSH